MESGETEQRRGVGRDAPTGSEAGALQQNSLTWALKPRLWDFGIASNIRPPARDPAQTRAREWKSPDCRPFPTDRRKPVRKKR